MKLSVIIPAHNEAASIRRTVLAFNKELKAGSIEHEILVINDGSKDNTEEALKRLKTEVKELSYLNNASQNGYGLAVKKGLENFNGDCVAIVMADMSDSPADLVEYYRKMQEGYDCIFGSRFIRGSKIAGYPFHKLILNRLGNMLIMALFAVRYNDMTNAFKLYRREVIDGIRPLLSHQFNLTVEMPLKAIIRGYSYHTIPISWKNRTRGFSKFKIKEIGSRYLFIIFSCLLEKWLSMGDYRRR
jgi:dolichol-phosphate mannosyltransferase